MSKIIPKETEMPFPSPPARRPGPEGVVVAWPSHSGMVHA